MLTMEYPGNDLHKLSFRESRGDEVLWELWDPTRITMSGLRIQKPS